MTNTWWCVNKFSQRFLLLSNCTCRYFFDCPFVNDHQHYRSWMSDYQCLQFQGVFFFAGNFPCNFTSWTRIAVFAICLIFRRLLFMRRDCGNKSFDLNMHVKFQKTSETSKSFENNILPRAIQSGFETRRYGAYTSVSWLWNWLTANAEE